MSPVEARVLALVDIARERPAEFRAEFSTCFQHDLLCYLHAAGTSEVVAPETFVEFAERVAHVMQRQCSHLARAGHVRDPVALVELCVRAMAATCAKLDLGRATPELSDHDQQRVRATAVWLAHNYASATPLTLLTTDGIPDPAKQRPPRLRPWRHELPDEAPELSPLMLMLPVVVGLALVSTLLVDSVSPLALASPQRSQSGAHELVYVEPVHDIDGEREVEQELDQELDQEPLEAEQTPKSTRRPKSAPEESSSESSISDAKRDAAKANYDQFRQGNQVVVNDGESKPAPSSTPILGGGQGASKKPDWSHGSVRVTFKGIQDNVDKKIGCRIEDHFMWKNRERTLSYRLVKLANKAGGDTYSFNEIKISPADDLDELKDADLAKILKRSAQKGSLSCPNK